MPFVRFTSGSSRGPRKVYVEFWDYTIHESPDMFYAVGRERGYLRAPSTDLSLAFRTSRIFSKLDGRWRQVHHHGSIEDPQLLAKYQTAVLGAQPDVAYRDSSGLASLPLNHWRQAAARTRI